MEKNSTKLSGFDAIVDTLSPNFSFGDDELSDDALEQALRNSKSPSVKEVFGDDEPEEIIDDSVEELEDDIEDDVEEEEEVPQSKKKEKKEVPSTKKEKTIEEPEEETEESEVNEEGIQVGMFFDAVAEELGLDFEEDEEKPNTVEGLVSYFKELIQENSVPSYSTDQVKELDEFVRNGGKLEDYFKVSPELDLDNIDLSVSSNSKNVLRKFLSKKGFSDAQITKKLTKYEDAGLLEDEAEDAIEALKEIDSSEKEALLEQQKNAHAEQVKQQQKFVDDVVNGIKDMSEIGGVKIPEKDKRTLLEFILKTDASGVSKFTKEYNKNFVKNLLTSAYLTMKGDTIWEAAKKTGSNSAIKTLKQSLNNSGVGKGTKRIKTTTSNTAFTRAFETLYKK